MNYPIRKEFKKYSAIRLPTDPLFLKAANAMMPVVQDGDKLDPRLEKQTIRLSHCTAELFTPKNTGNSPLLVYYHGGGFLIKAAAYHKNAAQYFALEVGCAVLLVDYRLAPEHPFPLPAEDCFEAYRWALSQGRFTAFAIGGDSAGANLALAVLQLAHREHLPLPTAQLLIYPLCDTRMEYGSMKRFTDTPLWNSTLNAKALALYTTEEDRHDPLVSPMEAEDLSFLPPAYIETCEFDCLHDEGIALAKRLTAEGVAVTLNETEGTIHGYDIAEKAPYVREQMKKRIAFLAENLSKPGNNREEKGQ